VYAGRRGAAVGRKKKWEFLYREVIHVRTGAEKKKDSRKKADRTNGLPLGRKNRLFEKKGVGPFPISRSRGGGKKPLSVF